MLKITNGTVVFEVTRGAFDGIYSRQGFHIVDETKHVKQEQAPKKPEKTEDELFLESIIEKPISQWSNAEVKRFAALKEIDISETKSANEAKDLIKAFLEENEVNE